MWLKRLIYSAPLRYFGVAVCGFAVDFTIYALIVWSGNSIYWANLAGFCVGAAVNVVLIRKFVFRESRYSLLVDIPLTMAANGTMLLGGMFVLWGLVEYVQADPYLAKLVANAVTFSLNYATRATFFRSR